MLLFLVDLINIENLIILFRLFYSLSFFNFIILRSRATSIIPVPDGIEGS